jgi:hypothetical protein
MTAAFDAVVARLKIKEDDPRRGKLASLIVQLVDLAMFQVRGWHCPLGGANLIVEFGGGLYLCGLGILVLIWWSYGMPFR